MYYVFIYTLSDKNQLCAIRGNKNRKAYTIFNINKQINVIYFAEKPRITLNPSRQVVRRGHNAQILCTAEGDQPITITWSKLSSRSLPPTVQMNEGLLRV